MRGGGAGTPASTSSATALRWSTIRARLPLPAQDTPGCTVLKLTPATTMSIDCVSTDVSSQILWAAGGSMSSSGSGSSSKAGEGGGERVRYRRKEGEGPKRDLSILITEPLSRLDAVRMGASQAHAFSLIRGGGGGGGGGGEEDGSEFMDGDEWKPSNVRPGGAALAASASSMALAAGPPRTLGHSSVLQCWLTGGKTYHLTPLSLEAVKK